jgi:cytochrome P450
MPEQLTESTLGAEQTPEEALGLPPRPDLNRFAMSVGFMLTPTRFLDACHRRCGDWFTFRPAPNRHIVVTCDPDAVKQVFTGDPNLLYAGQGNEILAPILGSASTLLLDGPEHLRHRRLLLPPFHGERMRSYERIVLEAAERQVSAWPSEPGRTFPALPSMQAITLEVITRAVLGVEDPDRQRQVSAPLRRLLDMIGSRARVAALILAGARSGPRSPWGKLMAARAEADLVLNEEIAARRASDPEAHDDILSMLLAARDEDGNPLSDKALRDELVTLLVAGHETTATALAWSLERLTRTPAALETLIAEQRAGHPEYLEAVCKETLRLRPVVPAVARCLQAPMRIGPWDLPAGVHIAPSIYLLHRRPDIYPEPLAFRPERFLGDDTPGTYEWIPFGGGVRRCLGASFALFEMKTVLGVILREAKLRPTPGRRGEGITRRAITHAPTRGARIALQA